MNKMQRTLPRCLATHVERSLRQFPVVVLTGARQTGKSTLARDLLGGPARDYRTLDDIDVLERSQSNPDALITSDRPLVLDEVQRSPDLLFSIKRAVDRDPRAGRFLLTGSANLAILGRVSESLAGRAVYRILMPMTLGERLGLGRLGRWNEILHEPAALRGEYPPFKRWREAVVTGGFPPAALAAGGEERTAWLDGYVTTYLERDLQMLSNISGLVDFRRLMRVAALRSAKLVNQTEIARDAGLSQATVHRHLNLLEASHLLHRLPAYAVNRTKRLIKSPRLFYCDSGLAAHLAGVLSVQQLSTERLDGPLLENLVLADLYAWRETRMPRPEILYWRTSSGEEVDFVIELGDRVIPIEVKGGERPRTDDTRHLHAFLDEYRPQATHGIVLHTGTRAELLSSQVWSIPLSVALGVDDAMT